MAARQEKQAIEFRSAPRSKKEIFELKYGLGRTLEISALLARLVELGLVGQDNLSGNCVDLGTREGGGALAISLWYPQSLEAVDTDTPLVGDLLHLAGAKFRQIDARKYLDQIEDEILSLVTAFHSRWHWNNRTGSGQKNFKLRQRILRKLIPGGQFILTTDSPRLWQNWYDRKEGFRKVATGGSIDISKKLKVELSIVNSPIKKSFLNLIRRAVEYYLLDPTLAKFYLDKMPELILSTPESFEDFLRTKTGFSLDDLGPCLTEKFRETNRQLIHDSRDSLVFIYTK